MAHASERELDGNLLEVPQGPSVIQAASANFHEIERRGESIWVLKEVLQGHFRIDTQHDVVGEVREKRIGDMQHW